MPGGQSVGMSICVWLGLTSLGVLASAQEPSRGNHVSPFAKSRLHEIAPRNAGGKYHYGIMGQIARPGVYELSQAEVQLLELIRHAGGLTQNATNQLRIVRQGHAGQQAFYEASLNYVLVPGDIVVADGPMAARVPQKVSQAEAEASEIQTADFVEPASNVEHEPLPVALMGVLNRPVIVPVSPANANLSNVINYLGQNPAISSQVKVLPVGRRGTETPSANAFWTGPCVLYFNPRHILADALPKFPDVYRPEDIARVLPPPEELSTADLSPVPTALPALPAPLEVPERSVPHSVVVLPAPAPLVTSEPPMISSLRELERQIPTPAPIKRPTPPKAAPPIPTPATAADFPERHAESQPATKPTSWWPYLGLALIVAACAGLVMRRRTSETSPAVTQETFAPVLAEEKQVAPAPKPAQPQASTAPVALNDDILNALVFNQLPVIEEPPASPEDKPASRKIFRLDPPEEQASAAVKKPHIARRPRIQPIPERPAPEIPQVEEPQESLGLLDQALRRANERRAA